jgi:hypothetical protein
VSVLDDFNIGIALCCTGSILLVMSLTAFIIDRLSDITLLIAFSIFLHYAGLMLVGFSSAIFKWQRQKRMYYDWGL